MSRAAHKRVNVTSASQLNAWLAGSDDALQSVMVVTHAAPDHAKHVSRADVAAAFAAHGWIAGPRETVSKHLLGHLARRR